MKVFQKGIVTNQIIQKFFLHKERKETPFYLKRIKERKTEKFIYAKRLFYSKSCFFLA